MSRFVPLLVVSAIAGCATEPEPELELGSIASPASVSFSRERVTGDIYHYEAILRVGTAPNAALRIHRVVREVAPFTPARTPHAVMLLHGDFSTFVTNFVPAVGDPASPVDGLAPYLADAGIDVWGVDRRWTLPGLDDDISDFAGMGVAQEIDDVRGALAFARVTRFAQGAGGGRIALGGFSHGAQLAYAAASVDAAKPAAQRHVDALVAIDYYGDIDPADADILEASCFFSGVEYQLVADGVIDSPSGFSELGHGALETPDATSPFGGTFRDDMLVIVGATYLFAPFAPFYHLAAPVLDGEQVVGFAESSETAIATWLAGATQHQAMIEAADFDALLCPTAPQPVDAPLSRIRVPLFYLGAAGGIGVQGLHATHSVSSTDVTRLIVQQFPAERRAEDFGHADLLFSADATPLAWQPLTSWLLHH